MTAASFDVVVAGGGPGGLSAAQSAARDGCSVLLVEQNAEIGSPTRTSGGSFVEDMQALGISAELYHPITRCRFLSPNNSVVFDYPKPELCVIDVRAVYQFLAEQAIEAGVQLRLATAAADATVENGQITGVRLKSRLSGLEEIRSKILVDATGYRATLLKQTGIHEGFQRFGVGAEYDLYAPNCDESEVLLIVGNRIAPAGYAWIFPYGKHRVRVGVGIIHGDSKERPEEYLDKLIATAADYGTNLSGAQPIEFHTGLIPSDGLANCFVGHGILGVGDAAGQPSALVGEGIRWAIMAGRMAGKAAAEAVTAGDCSKVALERYQKQWRKEFGADLRIAHQINRRIAFSSDEQWDERTEWLKSISPGQFCQALRTNFMDKWVLQMLASKPQLMPKLMSGGIRRLVRRFGLVKPNC